MMPRHRISPRVTTTISKEILHFCKSESVPIAELIRVGFGTLKYKKCLKDLSIPVADKNTVATIFVEMEKIKNVMTDIDKHIEALKSSLLVVGQNDNKL
jgi:hypothetical protein